MRRHRLPLLLITALLAATGARAGEVSVAVAANFKATLEEVGAAFTRATGHQVLASSGSTGKLYTQITQGAPFAVLLAADSARPERLEREGHAVAGSRFTYAVGRLVLWSPDPDRVDAEGAVLRDPGLQRLAIANPRSAPYGAAAQEVLEGLGLWDALQPRLVRGENIGQTFQFVASGNAPLGFVALAQVRAGGQPGSQWLVPQALHAPIEQQAVLLGSGANNPAARAFLDYLRGPEAVAIIERYGYDVPGPTER
ncbi:MAG: molybdate ABC transporter substrate-binding protein [Gammaproteobacteria bacterium]|nr:molybdate ABC transporter substrate-binding protein [Gammaproteobacteria bacterium]